MYGRLVALVRPSGPARRGPALSGPVAAWSLAAAAVLYQSWLLAAFLHPGLSASMLVSELAAADQPWAWLFRLADLVAGVLVVLAGLLAAVRGPARVRGGFAALAGFGAAAVAAALVPLSCAPSVPGDCGSGAGIADVAHAATSGLALVLVCLGGLLLFRGAGRAGIGRVRYGLAGCVLLVVVSGVLLSLSTVAFPVPWIGYVQRAGVLAEGGVLACAVPVLRRTAVDPYARVIDAPNRGMPPV